MLPLILDAKSLSMALVGCGPLARRRLALVREGGADPTVYLTGDDPELAEAAGARLVRRAPTSDEVGRLHVLFAAGLPDDEAETLTATARAANVLVNVEDVMHQCDFHVPSMVRRGDLLLTISTGGKSPALARLLRKTLERLFPAAWADRLDELARMRSDLRAQGQPPDAITRATETTLIEKGWLP